MCTIRISERLRFKTVMVSDAELHCVTVFYVFLQTKRTHSGFLVFFFFLSHLCQVLASQCILLKILKLENMYKLTHWLVAESSEKSAVSMIFECSEEAYTESGESRTPVQPVRGRPLRPLLREEQLGARPWVGIPTLLSSQQRAWKMTPVFFLFFFFLNCI